jgi:hypothetical protein
MQQQPQQAKKPAAVFVPPSAPTIPINAMQNLVPRLVSAINEIDTLRNQIAAGNVDRSLPNW